MDEDTNTRRNAGGHSTCSPRRGASASTLASCTTVLPEVLALFRCITNQDHGLARLLMLDKHTHTSEDRNRVPRVGGMIGQHAARSLGLFTGLVHNAAAFAAM